MKNGKLGCCVAEVTEDEVLATIIAGKQPGQNAQAEHASTR